MKEAKGVSGFEPEPKVLQTFALTFGYTPVWIKNVFLFLHFLSYLLTKVRSIPYFYL